MRLQVRPSAGGPDFLDLPWEVPLAEWDSARLVEVPRGLHRHVVRTVAYGPTRYFVKELPDRFAQREWELLRWLEDQSAPAVQAAALVTGRRADDGTPIDGAIVTRQLEFALPYRLLFQRVEPVELRDPMLDAMVDLLVRLHLVGFVWGDCSLSNTLFRRNAEQLQAYLVDAETGGVHTELSSSQRAWDLALAVEHAGGEIMDLQASGLLEAWVDPVDLGEELERRYANLWHELTRSESFYRDEAWRVQDRIRRINDLGFDLDEIELVGEGGRIELRLSTRVVEPGRLRRRLFTLTGIEAPGEALARALINDIHAFGAWLQWDEGREIDEVEIARQWLSRVYEPVTNAVPEQLAGRREAPQLFYEMLQHRHQLSRAQGTDVSNTEAIASYIRNVLQFLPEERLAGGADPGGVDTDGDDASDDG